MAIPCVPTGDKQVQLRRGTTAENNAFTGADGELSFDTDQNRLRVHDGVTAGGFPIAGTSITNVFTANQSINNNIALNTDGTAAFDGTVSFGGGTTIIAADGTVNFANGAATMSNVGTLFLPTLEVESQLTVETQTGAEGNVEFRVLNTDTLTPTFEIFGNGRIGFPDGIRQTFNPDGTVAGLNVGAFAGDPSTPINGDIWYDSTANELTARINGVNVALGASAPPFIDSTALVRGSADATKLLRFEVDGFTTGVTRVLTPQNASYIIAGTDIVNNFSQTQFFNEDQGIQIGTIFLSDPALGGVLNIVNGDVDIVNGGLFALDLNINLGSFAVSSAGVLTFADGVRQTFNPNGTTPGFNVGSQAGDPSTPINGDLWYDSTANELTARINGANVALGTGGYALMFATIGTLGTILDSTTYYFTMTGDSAANSTTYANVRIAIPKTGIIRRFDLLARVAGVLGSAETVSHFIRINDTTDVGQIDCAYNVASQNFSVTVNQAVVAGDFVAIKFVTPAWVTNPTVIRTMATIYIE